MSLRSQIAGTCIVAALIVSLLMLPAVLTGAPPLTLP